MSAPMDLETAQAVVAAHRRAQQEEENARRRGFIGRYFKYHNTYGGDERWWLYAAVTDVGEWGHMTGLLFEHTATDRIEIELRGSCSTIPRGWEEIGAAEFWGAAAELRSLVVARLAVRDGPA